MELIMSMVHHNPGEAPFKTAFNNPAKLKEYGYNTQIFKHLNAAITFDHFDERIFPCGSKERIWVDNFSNMLKKEMLLAKNEGLQVMHHLDLFVLPKKILELYQTEICDENGRISIARDMTLKIHRAMFDEMFERYPEIDGIIIRVGETYLHDTPYHTGNGAIKYGHKENEIKEFMKLLQFLREEICIRHNKKLVFRTWDCFPDRFHADLSYYIAVTDGIIPHENLIFSIKHTALDFWRRVKFNDCLAKGKHKQVIEVQCQREYEGKGAYPSYVMDGVINSFEEYETKKGIRDVADDPRICGVYVWPRGGGWYGPYPKNEFWSDINTYVIGKYAANITRTEEGIFFEYVKNRIGLTGKDAGIFRKVCCVSQTAILKGRYIEQYDKRFQGAIMPCANWMRDDRIGGLRQLKNVLEMLKSEGTIELALKEKSEAVELWRKIYDYCISIHWNGSEYEEFICTSADYGVRLFELVYAAWVVMVKWVKKETENLGKDICVYYQKLNHYQQIVEQPQSSTLYETQYWHEPGIGETIADIEKSLAGKTKMI
jgi:hypothetical protein